MANDVLTSEESAIARILFEYAHAIDAADVNALVGVLTDDAVIEYEGGKIRLEGRDKIGPYLTSVLIGPSTHLISNVLVDQDGGLAQIRASAIVCVTRHVEFFLVRGATYKVEVVQIEGKWKIAALFHSMVWEFRIPKTD